VTVERDLDARHLDLADRGGLAGEDACEREDGEECGDPGHGSNQYATGPSFPSANKRPDS
jgi:hypothetical protein